MFRARLRARLCRGKEGLHRAPTLSDIVVGIPSFCYYFYPPPTIVHFFIHFCPKYTLLTTLRPSKGGLKRQSLLQTWCRSAPRRGPSANGYDSWRLDPAARTQDPCSCCCRPGVGLRPAADHSQMVVVVVFFTLTDRASTIPSNTRGCQSGTWSAGQKKIRGTSTKLQ